MVIITRYSPQYGCNRKHLDLRIHMKATLRLGRQALNRIIAKILNNRRILKSTSKKGKSGFVLEAGALVL